VHLIGFHYKSLVDIYRCLEGSCCPHLQGPAVLGLLDPTLKTLQSFLTTVTIYQSPQHNFLEDMNLQNVCAFIFSALEHLLFIWNRGMQMCLNFLTWRKTQERRNFELGISSMHCGFLICSWSVWKMMSCGVSCVPMRVLVFQTVGARSLITCIQSKGCSIGSSILTSKIQ